MRFVSNKILLTATDLSNHLGCKHLTELNRLLALDKIAKSSWTDPALQVLAQRGAEHEAAYVKYLNLQGYTVTDLFGKPVEATIKAMRDGVDVIVQPELSEEGWIGRADILRKTNKESKLGAWSYEVQDTKLARNTKAATILQLALYSDMIASIQGVEPENMYVVKPGDPFEIETFPFNNFKAYYRLTKKSLVDVMLNEPPVTYPEPVEQCGICRWWKECDKKRHDDDHLSLIASVRAMHIGELQKQQITTLEQFALRDTPLTTIPDRGSKETYLKLHGQAKIQLSGRQQDKLLYELLPKEGGRGLLRLPRPSKGDIYFDIEGDPFFDQLGLEYLFGYAYVNERGEMEYNGLWAKNRREEKDSFGQFMDFVMKRLKQYPDLHIYHFSPYEPSTIKRLSLRHTTQEANLDWLLRAERFVDLYAVIREGLRASVERYSLKDLERFTPFLRKVELTEASAARRAVEFALELNDQASLTSETLEKVKDYNADDCLATHALHVWLEKLRKELEEQNELPRPELKTGEATEAVEELQVRAKAIFEGLTKTLPEDSATWNEHHRAKWLLANQIDYFRRESKSAWWEFFRLHEMNEDDLITERKAIAGLQYIGDVPLQGKAKLPIHRYRYPPQEVGIDVGDSLHEVLGEKIGTVHAISHEACTIDIKKTGNSKDIHPRCVHEEEVVTIEPLATSIFDIANAVIDDGLDIAAYRASKDLLLKRSPRLGTPIIGKLVGDNEDAVEAAVKIALQLKHSVLGIQGPPGSGKTYTGAMMILRLAMEGKRIGVTAPSHKVIRNLFDKVLELGKKYDIQITLVHKPKEESDQLPEGLEEAKDNKQALKALDGKKVVGGTAWLWAHNDARETLDYLFVDEAGQMSLAHVLAASRATKNLILLGDPQQLEQPQKAAHPEGADVAALTHLLEGHSTMPDEKGIFLGTTRRLHPRITQFTSEVFYENRLQSLPGLEKQVLHFKRLPETLHSSPNQLEHKNLSGAASKQDAERVAGLYYIPVRHEGNQNRSTEEISVIEKIVEELISNGVWTNERGETSPISKNDIVIVAPYNAQVAALAEKLPGYRIGTVDKFQGQEAAVVIYSMTSSSSNDAPRGMNFLYNPNRLNVATSRARCLCILVGSDQLLYADCRTVEQMKWVNALCRYKEMSLN
jgi:predicted RecB family nuclease